MNLLFRHERYYMKERSMCKEIVSSTSRVVDVYTEFANGKVVEWVMPGASKEKEWLASPTSISDNTKVEWSNKTKIVWHEF